MGKRGNGEGTVYQRASDGKWVGAVTLGNGKRRVVYGATRATAAEKLNQLLNDHSNGTLIADPDVTLNAFLDRWLGDSIRGHKRPKTERFYRQLVRDHITPLRSTAIAPAHTRVTFRFAGKISDHVADNRCDVSLSP